MEKGLYTYFFMFIFCSTEEESYKGLYDTIGSK